MGDFFNHFMDNLISATWRLLDLPMYVLVLVLLLAFALIYFLAHLDIKKFGLRSNPDFRHINALYWAFFWHHLLLTSR